MGVGHEVMREARGRSGVLPDLALLEAIDEGIVDAGDLKIPLQNVQPASLDLRLGDVAYRTRCSFLADDETVGSKVKRYLIDQLDLRDGGAVLETHRPYLVPLRERLSLPAGMRARTNPKSSTGRLDIFTRVITDHGGRFDEISPGYNGGLYLEIVPLSFPVRVRADMALNQIRLSLGDPRLSDEEIRAVHRQSPLLFEDGAAVPEGRLVISGGLFLGLDLFGDATGRVGYRSRQNAPLIDLTTGGPIDPNPYWEPVSSERDTRGAHVVLDPESFYLLMSDQSVSVPPYLASEMTAYDPTSGELRTHYAGFFDPGFGFDIGRSFAGSRAALEVRAHDVPFLVEHGQPVCKLTFEHMLEAPSALYGHGIGSSYQQQEETLSKYFARPSRGACAPRDAKDGAGGHAKEDPDQKRLFDPAR